MVVTLDAAAQREFLAAVAEGLPVFGQDVVVLGEGGVQAEAVVVCVGGCFAEFGFEDDDLQAGVGPGAAGFVQDGLRGVLLAGGSCADHRAEKPLGDGGLAGVAGVEGEQEPPLIRGCFGDPARFQLCGKLAGELQAGLAAAGLAEEVDGGPDAGFQAYRRAAGQG